MNRKNTNCFLLRKINIWLTTFFVVFIFAAGCELNGQNRENQTQSNVSFGDAASAGIITGAERLEDYLPLLHNKKIGIVLNHTAMVGNVHLLDTLLNLGVKVEMVFAPEHGIRGTADAGAHIQSGRDEKTGIPVRSLYGNTRKPDINDINQIDLMLFDLQDVGARFYTYISTLHYVMQACSEADKPLIVLDRPNPNGHYVDGPSLKPAFKSFVGMHPIPVVHGLTIGEYALMVNGEGWLENSLICDLTVITCLNYDHNTPYAPPVRPSPNLPDYRSILLYPSICFFEGTPVSVGRGTNKQFQVIGSPEHKKIGEYSFTPTSMPGATNPPHLGKTCYGFDLSQKDTATLYSERQLNLSYLITMYNSYPNKASFFNTSFFNRLAGSDQLMKQLQQGKSEAEIRASWEDDLKSFKEIRSKYLLYPDFE